MSFLGRLFGRPAPAPAPPSPPATPVNAINVPDDVAAALTAGGRPLGEAVESALREHLEEAQHRSTGSMPFWLQREDEGESQIEDELRDRLERRRAAEAAKDAGAPGPAAPDVPSTTP
jgi:hypothetical protein